MGNIPHRGEAREMSNIYMLMCYECVNSLEREKGSPSARRRRRPVGSARLGLGLGLGGGPPAEKEYSFWTKLNSTFCHSFREKTACNFI